jgi:hypothetical protein
LFLSAVDAGADGSADEKGFAASRAVIARARQAPGDAARARSKSVTSSRC